MDNGLIRKGDLDALREQAMGAYAKAQELIYFAKDESDHRVDSLLAIGALSELAWQLAENLRKFAEKMEVTE